MFGNSTPLIAAWRLLLDAHLLLELTHLMYNRLHYPRIQTILEIVPAQAPVRFGTFVNPRASFHAVATVQAQELVSGYFTA
jgi:hypothetical protein